MGHEDRGSWDWERTPQHKKPKELKALSRAISPKKRVDRALDQCEAWNRANPVGTPVTVLRDNGELHCGNTRSEAYVSNSGDPVVFVTGISGYYLLSRCSAVDGEKEHG